MVAEEVGDLVMGERAGMWLAIGVVVFGEIRLREVRGRSVGCRMWL